MEWNYLPDNELLQSDSEDSFRVLYDRYWMPLFLKARARLNNEEDAKDVIQELFISIWNNRYQIVLDNGLAPYLFTALKFSIIKKIQRDYSKGIFHPLNPEEIGAAALTNEEILRYKELEELLHKEVEKLPDRMKQIYLMSRHANMKSSEIAEKLNLSEQTVKNTLSVALNKLRSKLSGYKYMFFIL